MNCRLCQQEYDSYRDLMPSDEKRHQFDSHLRSCNECREFYRLQVLADKTITIEKELQVNPFISTRVMEEIERLETGTTWNVPQLLRPVLITISIAAAIFIGVLMGSIPQYRSDRERIPVELALIDDTRLESLDLLSNE